MSEDDAELRQIADIAQVLKQVYNTIANTAGMNLYLSDTHTHTTVVLFANNVINRSNSDKQCRNFGL